MGKLRMMLEPFIPARRDGADESIAGFVRRRLGDEAVRRIAGPLMAGIHAGDPKRLSLQATFPRLIDIERKYGSLTLGMRKARAKMAAARKGKAPAPSGPPFVSFKGGLQTLTDAMRAALERVEVITGAPVAELANGKGGYRVRVAGAPAWEADACLMAVPAWAAAGLVRPFAEPLARTMEKVRYVSTATVFMGFSPGSGVSIPPSTGFLVPRGEGRSFFGCTFVSNKFSGRAEEGSVLLRAFTGGAGDEDRLTRDDDRLVAEIRRDLKEMIGLTAEPAMIRVQRWERANPQYEVGHQAIVEEVDRQLESLPGLLMTGSGLRGVGVPDGVELGRKAADELLRHAAEARGARQEP
jgi:oxygen-dependent protoporphyrinogen oxidase